MLLLKRERQSRYDIVIVRFGLKGRGNDKKIKVGPHVNLEMSPNLTRILNYNSYEIDNSLGEERMLVDLANKATDPKFPAPWQHNIYVVCDGIEESFVNNGILRTLGTIHLLADVQYGQYQTIKFDNPVYRKWVGDGKLEEISIKFVDEVGEVIQRRSHTWALLHIRKISTSS